MTYKELEQFLTAERYREGGKRGTDMCGLYARCKYCDRNSEFPCALAYEAMIEENGGVPQWAIPEPPVKERFGSDRVTAGDALEERTQDAEAASAHRRVVRSGQKSDGVRVLILKRRNG